MRHYISRLSLAMAFVASATTFAHAQELNESLTVVGDYTPEIQHQERINILPEKLDNEVAQSELNYSSLGVPTDAGNTIFTMPVTGWQSTRKVSNQRGYVDFGMGSYLNIVGSAGYRTIDNNKTKAGIWIQHNSSSGFVVDEYDWNGWHNNDLLPDKVKKLRSDSRIGLYASHDFGVGTLNADLSYHYGRFNYYSNQPYYKHFIYDHTEIPMQNLNEVIFNTNWQAIDAKSKLSYKFDLGYHHFGYQHYYGPSAIISDVQKENHFSAGAHMLLPTDKGSSVGLDINADLLVYTDPETVMADLKKEDYGMISFTPYYRFNYNNININAGVKVDLTFNAQRQTYYMVEKYKFVHLAPQVKADWRKDWLGLWAHILGGSTLNTVAANSLLDYYQTPQTQTAIPLYSPIDLRLGVNIGRFAGFYASLLFDYKIIDNVNFGGLYMNFDKPYLNTGTTFIDRISAEMNIKGWRAGLKIGYQLSNLLDINATGYYANQDGEKGYFNGYDRPRWVIDALATIKPWRTLQISLGYQYRGVRNLYDYTLSNISNHSPQKFIYANRLPDVALLNIGASYRLLNDNLTIWAQANNLLSSPTALSPVMPEEGFNFLIGAGYNF